MSAAAGAQAPEEHAAAAPPRAPGPGQPAFPSKKQRSREGFVTRSLVVNGVMSRLREGVPSTSVATVVMQVLSNDHARGAMRYSEGQLQVLQAAGSFFPTLGLTLDDVAKPKPPGCGQCGQDESARAGTSHASTPWRGGGTPSQDAPHPSPASRQRTHSLARSLTRSLSLPLTHSPTHALNHALTHSRTHSLTHPPVHPPTRPPTHPHTHVHTHSRTHPLTYSLAYSGHPQRKVWGVRRGNAIGLLRV